MWIDNKNIIEGTDIPNNSSNEFNEKFKEYDWFKEFQDYLDTLDKQKKDEFLKVIEDNKNNPNIETYLDPERWWFPKTIEWINFFIKKYWKDIIVKSDNDKEKEIKDKEVSDKANNEKRLLEAKQKEIRNNISKEIKDNPLFEKYFTDKIIKETEKNPEYQEWLKNNKDKTVELFIIEKNYTKLLNIALETDKKKWIDPKNKDSNFSKLFTNLRSLQDSWLNIKVTDLDEELNKLKYSPNNALHPEQIELARLSIDTSEYHKTEIHWDMLVYWDQVVNLKTNEKFIKSKLWYLLKSSDLEFKDGREYQERIDKTNDEVKWIDKEIKSNNDKIWELNQVSLWITTLDLSNKTILDDYLYKRYLKTNNTPPGLVEPYNKLRGKIENVSENTWNKDLQEDLRNSLQEVNTLELNIVKNKNNDLFKQKDDLNKSLIQLKKDYEKSEKQFKSKLETKDKMQRESIIFINRIALDVIPQNLLNRLIDMLKSNMIIIPGLDIDRQAINLENQQFWNSVTVENETLWERNLIKFLNKLVYWEINPKDTIFKEDEIIKNPKFNIKPSTMRFTLESKDLMGSDWFHINKMIQNLRKVEKTK